MMRIVMITVIALSSSASIGLEDRGVASPPLREHATQATVPAGGWKAGTHFTVIDPPQPTHVAAGQVEVAEAFWYSCPHCNALEPQLVAWSKTTPAYVTLVRIPVVWDAGKRADARLYYTLQALGRADLHQEVFDTIHQHHQALDGKTDSETLQLQLAFATAHGIKKDDFLQTYSSPAVEDKLTAADKLTRGYRITGVPSIIVGGRYATDTGRAGSTGGMFELINVLTAREKHR